MPRSECNLNTSRNLSALIRCHNKPAQNYANRKKCARLL